MSGVQVGILVGVVSGVHSEIIPEMAWLSLRHGTRDTCAGHGTRGYSRVGAVAAGQQVAHVEALVLVPGEPLAARRVAARHLARPDVREVGHVPDLVPKVRTENRFMELG